MKKVVLRLLYSAMSAIGVFALLFRLQRARQRVVTFHNVIDDELFDPNLPHFGASCTRSQFIQQLEVIQSRFEVVTGIGVPGTCIVSFDDGYRNNIDTVAPILRQRGMNGVFFVPACYLESGEALWIDELLMWASYAPAGTHTVLGTKIQIDDGSRHQTWSHLYELILSNYSQLPELRNELNQLHPFEKVRQRVGQVLYRNRFEPMSAADVEQMAAMGHLIGCHSFKHDVLSKLSETELAADFDKCQRHRSKYNTGLYAYPFGGPAEVSPSAIAACRQNGYSFGFLNYEPRYESLWTIGRICLGNCSERLFIEAKLCGFEQALRKVLSPIWGTALGISRQLGFK